MNDDCRRCKKSLRCRNRLMSTAPDTVGLDPRIRRTRQSLQDALEKLLSKKDFEEISVQDVAETATLNRATFYDHYPDKFACWNAWLPRVSANGSRSAISASTAARAQCGR